MSSQNRWLIAAGVIAVDLLVFMIPVVPLVAVYVLLTRPPWFKTFVDDLYEQK
jgi:hypothetical protein